MKGWRPSASEGLEPDRAFSSGRTLAGHQIDRPVFTAPRSPDHGDPWAARFPHVRFNQARGRQVGQMASMRPRVMSPGDEIHDRKMAPALHLLHETGGPRNHNKKERHRGEQAAPTLPVSTFKPESPRKRKKGRRGRRNSLLTLDSAKEIQGFSLLKFGRALLDEPRIWLDLDLAWTTSRPPPAPPA